MKNRYVINRHKEFILYLLMFRILFLFLIFTTFYNNCICYSNNETLNNMNHINHNHNHNSNDMDNMDEYILRDQLFRDYNSKNIPILNSNDNIVLKYGIQIESLEYFNQVSENIKFNTIIIQQWTYDLLIWNNQNHSNHNHN